MTTFEEEQVAAMYGGKRRRRNTKRKSLLKKKRTKKRGYRGKSPKRRKRRKKSRRKSKRRKSSKRRRRRRQRGGAVPGSGRLPQGQLTRQNFGQLGHPVPLKSGQKGGSMLWRNLGLTWPKDVYNDSMSYLRNIKNTYAGDYQESTSNVLKQPISDARPPSLKPVNYLDKFNAADASTAGNLKI
jgi:hypothetical protein